MILTAIAFVLSTLAAAYLVIFLARLVARLFMDFFNVAR